MQETEDAGSIPGLGRSPGGGLGNPLQCSCLKNPMDRGAWRAVVYRVAESDTTEATEHACKHMISSYLGSVCLVGSNCLVEYCDYGKLSVFCNALC